MESLSLSLSLPPSLALAHSLSPSQVSGNGVYGAMKFESGVHRVQRVPITDGAQNVEF